ncbi:MULTISPECIES: ABC-2 transporter permease [Paenibacillus]|uniref:ABC-2 transporter permease n=1 Tax=Paenibacillus TaxID=44249 RepID=UPI00035E40D3|nr:ABC-2 transporter permease [Paenibacillus massiliensis]
MRGLILNNLYSLESHLKISFLIVGLVNIMLFFMDTPAAAQVAVMLSIILIPANAFSLMKQHSSAGWDRYELTLPLARQQIIQSKYATFILLLLLSVFVTLCIQLIIIAYRAESLWPMYNLVPRGSGIILCSAALTYPLGYAMGPDKAEIMMILSIIFSFGVFGAVFGVYHALVNHVIDEQFSSLFLMVAICLFGLSYFVTSKIYSRKEFR